MTNIDDLFKKPHLPSSSSSLSSSQKRKLSLPDAHQPHKSTKLSPSPSSPDIEAGPSPPPPSSPSDPGDDDSGRFFGSGMTASAISALSYIDSQEPPMDGSYSSNPNSNTLLPPPSSSSSQHQSLSADDDAINPAWVRRLATSFSRKIALNAEQRAKHEGAPEKFMASEAALDEEVKRWSLLADHPALYGELAGCGAVGELVGLLAHENTDIAIGAVEILAELLDEDVRVEEEGWRAVVEEAVRADLVELLLSNLRRLDEGEGEGDREGVYYSLAVMESVGSGEGMAERVGTEEVLDWLGKRMSKGEEGGKVGQNRQYAAEVLQVLLQESKEVRRRMVGVVEGVDLVLQLLAQYRRKEVERDSYEEEYVENLFDALTCVVDEEGGKGKLVAAEGVELMLILVKEGSKNTVNRALRVLDHALGGRRSVAAVAACERLVDAAGLKPVFSAFMKKASGAALEHLLGIFSTMLRLLPGESAARIRTLAKFTEKDGEKVEKLVSVRKDFAQRVAVVDKQIRQEQHVLTDEEIEDRADEWFSRRLDGGLFSLQMTDVILAWLVAEDADLKRQITSQLGGKDGLESVRASLQAQRDGLETGSVDDEETKEMLETLISFLV